MVVSFIGGGNQSTRRKPLTCRKSLTNFITQCCIEYISPKTGFKLTMLLVIGTDCRRSCKSNYLLITFTTATTAMQQTKNGPISLNNKHILLTTITIRNTFNEILTNPYINLMSYNK